MSSRRSRLVLVVAAAVALAGCTQPSNSPDSFDTVTELNFMEACVGSFGFDMADAVDYPAGIIDYPADSEAAQRDCVCRYTGITDEIAFADWDALDDTLWDRFTSGDDEEDQTVGPDGEETVPTIAPAEEQATLDEVIAISDRCASGEPLSGASPTSEAGGEPSDTVDEAPTTEESTES